jgi:2-polyprenyl-3-methyl-5-hydroxy-6-metoxy-1,4-benzoquinol methylase
MITTPKSSCDKTKTKEFSERLLGDTAAAVRSGLNYIGDRLGIFKAMADSAPVTAKSLAEKTGLNQRYLQEWLDALAAARYLEYDVAKKTYRLPPEHAAVLADENSPFFAGGAVQMPHPLLNLVPKVMEAFRTGGGVTHDAHHPEMVEATERFTRPFFIFSLTQECIPAMPDIEKKLHAGCEVADIGCGAGQAVIEMAKAYPKSHIHGFDNHVPSIERAQVNARQAGVKNVSFACQGAESLVDKKRFPFITTFDVIHDMVDPLAGLRTIRELLSEDGTYLMLEMNASDKIEDNINPLASLFYSVSTLYCMTVSLAEGGAGIGTCMGEARAKALTKEAGFKHFRKLPVENPFSLLYEIKH